MSERLDKMFCKDKGVRKRRRDDVGAYIGWANNKLEELLDVQSRIDTAQTDVMYDVDGGLLSHNRASRHDREVDVALVVIVNESTHQNNLPQSEEGILLRVL